MLARMWRIITGKEKLQPSEARLFKLAIWAALVVWMVSFLTISFFVAVSLKEFAHILFGTGIMGNVMAFLWGASWITTVLYILAGMARFANRKLRGNNEADRAADKR